MFKVKAGKTILEAALLKLSVKLCNADKEVRFVGKAAAAFVLKRVKSCTLASVAPEAKVMAPLILLA